MTPREWLLCIASWIGIVSVTALVWALVVLLFTLETVDVADAERHFMVLQQMRGER